MTHVRARFVLALAFAASACGSPPSQGEAALEQATPSEISAAKRQLRVALYPYLPADVDGKAGLARLRDMIESRFEAQHPDIDLALAEMDAAAPEYYDKAGLAGWLRNTYDIVEIDTAMLGEVTDELAEWVDPNRGDWHPAAREAVTYRGRTYGVPHLQCSHFVYTRDARVITATNVNELVQRLDALPSSGRGGKMSAPVRGTWTLPSLFLDAYEDGHPGASVDGVLSRPNFPDARLLGGLAALVRTCAVGEHNPCLGDDYKDANPAIDDFAAEKTGAYIGFSESLHRILVQRNDAAPIFVSSAPLGAGSFPLLFTDALVRSKGCRGACARDAQAFADFLDSPATMELLMMGDDLESGVPRYLLPATKSAFRIPRVARDATYRTLERLTRFARPFPNHDFYGPVSDGTLAQRLLEKLEQAQH